MFHLFLRCQVTLTALEEMFQGARSIMNWLGECAKVCYNTPYMCTLYILILRHGKKNEMLCLWGRVVYVFALGTKNGPSSIENGAVSPKRKISYL